MAQVTFVSHLDEVLKATDAQLNMAGEIIGGMAESYAKEEITRVVYDTPESPNYVRTGLLRNSITHGMAGGKTAITSYTAQSGGGSGTYDADIPAEKGGGHVVVIGSNVEYAPYVELGTSRGMPPRPYLRPAIENHIKEYKDVLKQILSE